MDANDNEKEMITKEEALRQIRLSLRRTSLMYHYFSKVILEDLGEERGTALIRKAIHEYGFHIGRDARRKVDEKGLAPVAENFESDLPMLAWNREAVIVQGEKRVRIHHCPLGEEWLQLGSGQTARLYCFVDQAKTQAFNPDYEYIHIKNILDGDPYCEMVIRSLKKD